VTGNELATPDVWRWIWLVLAATFALGELAATGTFFLISFAIGAALACVAAFAGAAVAWQWLLFVGASAVALAVLRPLGRRLDRDVPEHTVGANRWVGRVGVVISDIPAGPHDTGLVRLEREEWRAEHEGTGTIPAGTPVLVTRVAGTRLIVRVADPASRAEAERRAQES
jgi:membrane protein implicated in regulation of membrane protease activity